MKNPAALRHELIEMVISQHPAAPDDAACLLWNAVAEHLVVLIGEEGFLSLYRRSIFLTRQHFVWLTLEGAQTDRMQNFSALQNDLHRQLHSGKGRQALVASIALFCNFSDVLAGLIGEALTSGLLQAAWSAPAAPAKSGLSPALTFLLAGPH